MYRQAFRRLLLERLESRLLLASPDGVEPMTAQFEKSLAASTLLADSMEQYLPGRSGLAMSPAAEAEANGLVRTGPLDIRALVAAGTASVTGTQSDIGTFSDVFDDNPATLYRSANANPAFLQVSFATPRTIREFRTLLSHAGGDPAYRWRIEAADTQNDLDGGRGSYALLVPWTGTPSEQESVVTLTAPVTARLVKLTVQRLTGDNYVHIREWTLIGDTTFKAVTVHADSESLRQFGRQTYQALAVDSDGASFDYTSRVVWSSTAPEIATVDSGGTVTALAPGRADIVATLGTLSGARGLEVQPPGRVDLDVTFVERTPRYVYDAAQNHPAPGDLVTYHGHVRNWANQTAQAEYSWTLDGVQVASGVLTDLLPDEERVVEYAWTWLDGPHTLGLTVDPDNHVAEASEVNNQLQVRTDAILVGFWVEQSVYDYFHQHQQELGLGSNSWEDWAQRQMQQWNLHSENSVYPIAPQGVLDRVAIDTIVIVPDGALPLNGGIASNHPDLGDKTVDLMWGFPKTLLDGTFYADHSSLMEGNAFYLEPSLIHELGHARYLIDNYGFDVHRDQVQIQENGQPVAGSTWMPFIAWDSVLYYNQTGGIMSGPWRTWSPYEAASLNLIAGRRASQGNYNAPGNIGVFLQDLPARNHVRFVDADAQPLAGANVRVYQAAPGPGWYGKTFDNAYDLEFTTDTDGYAHLPRNPFSSGPIVHTYGQTNGIVVLRIELGGEVWYRFLEVTEFNLAYWRGHTADAYYTIELPPLGSPPRIELRGYDQPIPAGDNTPSPADQTDFGSVPLGAAVTRQLVIKNRGGTDLRLTGARVEISGPDAADFTLVNPPADRIPPGEITTFQVKFVPAGAGPRRATITISSDDAAAGRYAFDVAGSGPAVVPEPQPNWPLLHHDIWNTSRAEFVVPPNRLNASFFDVFAWQTPAPGSPNEGQLDSSSMVFYDGAGPDGADVVVAGYHWPKGVQGMNRQTGQVLWAGNPDGGESIGSNSPAFSNDGSVVYVSTDSTPHPLMAFTAAVGPSQYWHNGTEPPAAGYSLFSPQVAPDGRVFTHLWNNRPLAVTDMKGVGLQQTWTAESDLAECVSNVALDERQGTLRVVAVGRTGDVVEFDGQTGAEQHRFSTGFTTDADPTIDPVTGNVYVPLTVPGPSGSSAMAIVGLNAGFQRLPQWSSAVVQLSSSGGDPTERAQSGGGLSWDGLTYYFQSVSDGGHGQLYALDTRTGLLKWSFDTGSQMHGDAPVSSPIITRDGLVIVGNNEGRTYYAIQDDGSQGTAVDTLVVDVDGNARASATLSSDGLLYLPLRTVQTVSPPGQLPTYRVENLFTALDLNTTAAVKLSPPAHQQAWAGNHAVTVQWEELVDPANQFDHYAIYRSTAPFSSVTEADAGRDRRRAEHHAIRRCRRSRPRGAAGQRHALLLCRHDGGEGAAASSRSSPRSGRARRATRPICRWCPSPAARNFRGSPPTTRTSPRRNPARVLGPTSFPPAPAWAGGRRSRILGSPKSGDNVTYTATVRNRGTNAFTGTLSVSWFLDGQQVLDQSRPFDAGPAFAPEATTTFAYALPWDDASHELTFVINTSDARPENNQLTSDPLAVPFLTYVDRSFLEQFREEWTRKYPQARTDDILDWLNSHLAKFNQMFAAAGSHKRVRYGVLQVLDDAAPDPALDPNPSPYAIFPFRYRAGVDGDPRAPGYYSPEDDIDYGLLHEMGHQLGLIDLYQLNLDASQNQVSHQSYRARPDLMNGVDHFLSPASALAMEHWLHQAHGYYGQYLYNLPETLQLRFLGYDGQPLENAQVTVYQSCERPGQGKVIANQAKFRLNTDAGGLLTLPNVAIDPNLVPPIVTGDQLQPNPFGYLAVVGTNGGAAPAGRVPRASRLRLAGCDRGQRRVLAGADEDGPSSSGRWPWAVRCRSNRPPN